jgi:hypothetical protein
MRLRAIVADRLALALLAAQKVDQRTPEEEAEQKCGDERPARADGDVAEQVEDPAPVPENSASQKNI